MDLFAKRLRERARQLQLSDAEVARRAGLAERRYGHYVRGMREPDYATLLRICAVLDATPVQDAMREGTVSAETPGAPALFSALPKASAGPGTALEAELGSVPEAVSRPWLMAKAEIGGETIETKSVDVFRLW